MGTCGSSEGGRSPESKVIDETLATQKKEQVFKVLLLGSGDSGKTTFIKQMTLLFCGSFTDVEKSVALKSIHKNMIDGIKILVGAVPAEKFASKELKRIHGWVTAQPPEGDAEIKEWAQNIPVLWEMKEIKDAYKKRSDVRPALQLACGIDYFFDDAGKFFSPGYKPSQDDVLRTRTKTTGVQEYSFPLEKVSATVKIIDVGGQRAERRKWMHQFDNCDLVIYFSSLIGYSMTMEEDSKTNRLQDDLALFNSLMQLIPMKKSWIFFQNKSDLFAELIKKKSLSQQFAGQVPEAKEFDYDYNIKFLQDRFREKWTGDKLSFHTTCALDSDQMKTIWETLHKDLTRQHIQQVTGI